MSLLPSAILSALLILLASVSFAQQPSLLVVVAQDTAEKTSAKSDAADEPSSTATDETETKESDADDDDADDEEKGKKEKKPSGVSLKGSFIASDETKVARQLKEWTEMRVISAVEHGQRVRKGDVLVELETDKIDLAITDLKYDLELSEISLRLAEKALELLRRTTPMTRELAERSERRATEDLKRFLTLDREASKKSYDFSLRNAENYLAYQSEELKQLEQMYEADDLTEETEEIILKRTRDSVETAKFSLQRAIRSHAFGNEIELPRKEEALEEAVKQAASTLR